MRTRESNFYILEAKKLGYRPYLEDGSLVFIDVLNDNLYWRDASLKYMELGNLFFDFKNKEVSEWFPNSDC